MIGFSQEGTFLSAQEKVLLTLHLFSVGDVWKVERSDEEQKVSF